MSQPVTGSDYCTCELVAATSAGATTLLVSTPTEPFPTFDASNTYWYLTIVDAASYAIDANPPVQREIVKVTDYSTVSTGYSLTCVRGSGGTTAQIWASGAICEIRPCAQWFQDLKTTTGVAWGITDGITTVSNVQSLFVEGGVVADLGISSAGLTTAPPGASYLTLGTNSTLTNERVLTAGTNITFVDSGAGGTLTINASGGGSGDLLSYTATMSSADLLGWYAGGDFEFVPAPDGSHYIFPVQQIFQFDSAGTPYTTNGAQITTYYGTSSGYLISSMIPTTLLAQSENAFISKDAAYDMSGFLTLSSECAGQAIIGVIDEPLADGNGEMTITTYYFLRSI